LNCTLHLANIAALGHWLRALVIALVATAGGIGCNNSLPAVTAGGMGALVAMAGGMGLAHWSAHWLQWPAALAVIVA